MVPTRIPHQARLIRRRVASGVSHPAKGWLRNDSPTSYYEDNPVGNRGGIVVQ